ncbi:MAG: hypothetical protein ACT4OX_04500 [Actinomycetota bacterium]
MRSRTRPAALRILVGGFALGYLSCARSTSGRSSVSSRAGGSPSACSVGATYVLAGITKLRDAGLGWLDGDILRNHVAYDNVRKAALGADSSPIAGAVLDHGWLFAPISWATLAVELGPWSSCSGSGGGAHGRSRPGCSTSACSR